MQTDSDAAGVRMVIHFRRHSGRPSYIFTSMQQASVCYSPPHFPPHKNPGTAKCHTGVTFNYNSGQIPTILASQLKFFQQLIQSRSGSG